MGNEGDAEGKDFPGGAEVKWSWDNSKAPCPESNDTGGTWIGTRYSDAGTGSACTVQESDTWVLGHFTTTGGNRQPVVKLDHDHPDN